MYNLEKQAFGSITYDFAIEFTYETEFYFGEASVEVEYKAETQDGFWQVDDSKISTIYKVAIYNTSGDEVAPYPSILDAMIKTLEDTQIEHIDQAIYDEIESSEYY
jgi:hypothetical protein